MFLFHFKEKATVLWRNFKKLFKSLLFPRLLLLLFLDIKLAVVYLIFGISAIIRRILFLVRFLGIFVFSFLKEGLLYFISKAAK